MNLPELTPEQKNILVKYHSKVIETASIELDLVDYCNLSCSLCVRGCDILDSKIPRKTMGLNDVKRFIDETKDINFRWKTIKLVGGEPTLHPQLFDILNMFTEFKKICNFSLHLYTNGTTEISKNKKQF